MGRKGSFEQRTRAEVERIKGEKVAANNHPSALQGAWIGGVARFSGSDSGPIEPGLCTMLDANFRERLPSSQCADSHERARTPKFGALLCRKLTARPARSVPLGGHLPRRRRR